MQFCRNHRITEQVMVGTHGQLKNLYSKRILKFQAVRIVVFDEADEMLKASLPVSPNYQMLGAQNLQIYLGKMCWRLLQACTTCCAACFIDPCHSLCSGNR